MLALLAAALLAQAAPAPPPPDEEIVVTGERPRNFQIVTKRAWLVGPARCALKPSSGDPLFDAAVCRAYLACVPTIRSAAELEACIRPPIADAAQGWQDRRKAAMAPRRPAG
ncbi:hypothetical protein ASE67_09030 [Sphingomonas sp. Leaf23]|uniref:hypothetical protein n=1 Tax=Sphingomonas sp. Leaf23 TaxID=1735689 RepID=UPI00070108C2|nr:hypothetical protein [Sphingomonas sp. Leaf23]KQM86007.1 hypothetical protein ASE67_09030 [Sphingomonas sp. Leaf23]